jgi:hypothetical protein
MKAILALLVVLPVIAAAEPKPDLNCITLPTFVFDQRHAVTAGVAWPLAEAGKQYLVTAHHILGPAGGIKTQLTPRDVAKELKAIAGLCLGDSTTVLLGTPALFVASARLYDENGGDSDVAVVRLPDARGVKPLVLTGVAAKKNDPVWLFVRLVDRDRPTLYPATVIEVTPGFVQYKLDDKTLNLRAATGAPVLNTAGEVIAMHLGFGKQDTTALVGIACPAPAIRARIREAESGEKQP